MKKRDREMAQQSRSQTVLEEDPHFILTNHTECSQLPVTQCPPLAFIATYTHVWRGK